MTHCYMKYSHVLNKNTFISWSANDTKKPEEQYVCYNSTSFTNHRTS